MKIDYYKPYENLQITLEENLEKLLEERALELNMTKEELIREVLLNAISEEISYTSFEAKFKELDDASDTTPEFLKKYWIITDKDNKPIARCLPL
jgi:hypothetical protein